MERAASHLCFLRFFSSVAERMEPGSSLNFLLWLFESFGFFFPHSDDFHDVPLSHIFTIALFHVRA